MSCGSCRHWQRECCLCRYRGTAKAHEGHAAGLGLLSAQRVWAPRLRGGACVRLLSGLARALRVARSTAGLVRGAGRRRGVGARGGALGRPPRGR